MANGAGQKPPAGRKAKVHKWRDLEARVFTPEQIAASKKRVAAQLLEMSLAELRKHLGVTQAQLAELAEMAQGAVSEAERRDDHRLSTLRRVVEALGGRLEVRAVFDERGEEVRLSGV